MSDEDRPYYHPYDDERPEYDYNGKTFNEETTAAMTALVITLGVAAFVIIGSVVLTWWLIS